MPKPRRCVLPRLAFVRDALGVVLNDEIFIQVFQKVKKDRQADEDSNKILLNFQLGKQFARKIMK